MRRSIFILVFFPLFTACQPSAWHVGYPENSCIKETDLRYSSSSDFTRPVYKIEEIKEKKITLSVWQNNNWRYLGHHKRNYFHENRLFSYSDIDCPDEIVRKGIAAKLRKIKI